jgi:hypothetical protein
MNAAHTPTPRTDTAWQWAHNTHPWDEVVSATLSRQLERELTEAQDRIDDLTATGIHSCHAECGRPNCVLRREITKATKQRDALAEALRALKELGPPSKANNIITTALATLEGSGSNPAQKSPPTTP